MTNPLTAPSAWENSTQPIAGLAALDALAQSLATSLRPGDVVALSGDLGAGKTTLVQRLARHLGVREPVTSPTFVLMHEYHAEGGMPLLHADFYRLEGEQAASLAEEIQGVIACGNSLVIVEWAEFGPFLAPFVTLSIHLGLPSQAPPTHADPAMGEPRTVSLRWHRAPEASHG